MIRDGFRHGFDADKWESAKSEARLFMIERARRRGMVSYSELVANVFSIELQPHDPRLFHFLGEIAKEEDTAGRGMLTAVVVHKTGDMEPGSGFYELANRLGRDTTDEQKCWIAELHKVHAHWATN